MKKNKVIKFGILGLGRVVDIRVARVFLYNEVNNSKVVAVYDKDKKKKH